MDLDVIANNFARYLSEIYAPNNDQRAGALYIANTIYIH